MQRRALVLAAAALACSHAARAQEGIGTVNNQESLAVGLAPLHATEQASGGATNTVAGTRFLFGYAAARSRTVFGIPDLYTDFDVQFGVATLRYGGSSLNPPAGAATAVSQSVSQVDEALRVRLGRSFAVLSAGSAAITPFLGVSQRAWVRDATDNGIANFHYQVGSEAGLLVQAALPWHLVLGADAAVGRTLGTVIFDGYGNTLYGRTTAFALALDHRTFANWHQRVAIRQSTLRYAPPAAGAGSFEPRRTADLAFLFEVGGETGVFDP